MKYLFKNNMLYSQSNYSVHNYKILNKQGRLTGARDFTQKQAVKFMKDNNLEQINAVEYFRLTNRVSVQAMIQKESNQ